MASCDWIDDHRPLIHLDAPKAMIEGCLHGARERSQQPEGQRDQDIYLRALERSVRTTRISYGNYVARVATAPLATTGRNGRPAISRPHWPLMMPAPLRPGFSSLDSSATRAGASTAD